MKYTLLLFSITASLVLSIFFAGCASPPQQNTDDSIAADQEAVKAALVDMWDAIEKGDIERYAGYIHPDFTSFGETAKVLRSGKAAEVKAIKDWIDEPTIVHTEMKDPIVTINGEVAWITYYWSDSGKSKGVPFATKGKSTRIFVKENKKWLCIHGHFTLLENEAPPEQLISQ